MANNYIKTHHSLRYDGSGNDRYSIYEEYYNSSDADEVIQILKKIGLDYDVEKPTPEVANTLLVGGQSMLPVAIVYANPDDFQQIDSFRSLVLMALANGIVPTQYHLRDFSTDDLFKVLHERDKWHFQDIVFAKALLAERDVPHEAADMAAWRYQQEQVEWIPKSISETRLIGLWIVCTLLSATAGYIAFFFALPLPFFIWSGTTKDVNGKSHPTYNENTRYWGIGIFLFSLAAFYFGLRLHLVSYF
jgi:hypothetical protein